METVLLNELMEKSSRLSEVEKQELIKYLLKISGKTANGEAQKRKKTVNPNILWLKQHRDEVAGNYVALEKGRLVGQGKTLREAEKQAIENGAQKPLLTYIPAKDEEVFGGW